MKLTEEQQRIIQQAHDDLDRQLQEAFKSRKYGTLGVFVYVKDGLPDHSGIDVRTTQKQGV